MEGSALMWHGSAQLGSNAGPDPSSPRVGVGRGGGPLWPVAPEPLSGRGRGPRSAPRYKGTPVAPGCPASLAAALTGVPRASKRGVELTSACSRAWRKQGRAR